MARRKESRDETWYSGKTDDVHGSLDIKTAFDEAKPKRVAKILDGHDTHGWLLAALLREMSGLSGKATFECINTNSASIDVTSRKRGGPTFVAEDGNPDLSQCGGRMDEQMK